MTRDTLMKRMPASAGQIAVLILAAFILAALAATISATPRQALSAENSSAMTGYLWSDTIGWIDLNCSNTNACASNPFGFSVASDGTISGYAWSENIGWVSANGSDVAGCPSGTCTPKLSGGAVSGWLRAISGGTSQSGGWDGFISLSGTGYGVTKGSGAYFSGYAWGDINVGWVDFSRAQLAASCVPQNLCVGNTYSYQDAYCQVSTVKVCTGSCTIGGCSEDLPPPTATLTARPNLILLNSTTRIIWSSTDSTSCSLVGNNGDSTSGLASPSGGYETSPLTDTTVYTLTCTGDGGSAVKTTTVRIAPTWIEL